MRITLTFIILFIFTSSLGAKWDRVFFTRATLGRVIPFTFGWFFDAVHGLAGGGRAGVTWRRGPG